MNLNRLVLASLLVAVLLTGFLHWANTGPTYYPSDGDMFVLYSDGVKNLIDTSSGTFEIGYLNNKWLLYDTDREYMTARVIEENRLYSYKIHLNPCRLSYSCPKP